MSFSCTNQQGCPVILDSKCVIYEGENLLYIGVNTNDNYRTALENINTVIGNLILTGGITELTGDVVAVGPGVTVATLATVNSTPGQYGSSTAIPKLTVDGKGRITAITTDPVFIPSGALSFIGDVTGTGNTGSNTTLTLATVNNNVFINNSFLKFAVNAKGLITSASPVNFSDIDAALGYTPYSTTNPANYISRLGLSASSPLAYNNVTGNFTIQQATSTTDGYLSSVNWNTFNSKQPAGNYITDLTGEATATGPGSANVTLDNGAVTAKVLTGVNITGGNVVDTDTILTAFGKLQNQINSLIGSSIYKGTWNAATNTPTLTSGVGTRGWYYIVNTYGTTNLDGVAEWHVGDWAIFDGTAWQKVDTTDAVVSVNGQVGAVSLTTDNIPEGATNRYFTNTRARQAFSAGTGLSYDDNTGIFSSTITQYTDALARQAISLTTTGTSGAATYNNTTGVLNIPNYSTDLSGYVPYTGATANVNLGLNNLTANNVFGETSLNIKVLPSGSVFSTGYSTLSSLAGKFTMAQEPTSGNLKAFTFDFSAWATNTSRTYTLPDLSGTLALLEGSQTFSGIKTFSNQLIVTGTGLFDNGFLLKDGAVSTAPGYFSIASLNSTTLGFISSSGRGFDMVLPTSGGQITIPNGSGTLALTSQIPSLAGYVPTSRTITINGTTQDLSADRSWTISATGGVTSFNTRTGAVTLSSADVTGALGFTPANGANYLPLAGGTLSGVLYSTRNTASGIANNSFNVAKTIIGNLHIQNGSGTSGDNYQGAITFQGGTASEAQAGIYVSNNGSTGTAMGFATTGSYATGPQLFMTATNDGVVNFPRAVPTVQGNAIWNAGNFNPASYLPLSGGAMSGTITITNSDIRSNAASNWTGDPGTQGKIQYHANRWYIVADSSSDRIVQFRRNGTDTSWISNDGTFIGSVSGNVSGTASGNVVVRGQSNWNDSTVINNVVGLMAWKNYGNGHVIFDASQGTSPSGGGVSQTNATFAWTASYPTLMGWNGGNTYGVRVDSARVADSASSVSNGVYTNAGTNSLSGILNFGAMNATPYANPTGTSNGISFGGYESSSLRQYGIFTELENIGGNYSKLTFNYHTGIRLGASASYGGTRFYNDAAGSGSMIFSVGNGDSNVRAVNDIIAFASDKRLKHNVQLIENALLKVTSLTGMTYQWNEVGSQYGWEADTETREVGVFAQDVQAVLPEAVRLAPFDYELGKSKSGKNFLTVKYEKIVPLLIEAIKEQQLQIEELKSIINDITK